MLALAVNYGHELRLMILAEAKHLLKVANLKANVGIENGW